MSFLLTAENPAGALSINESTGELTVLNTSLFDFETRQQLTATYAVTDQESGFNQANIIINLTDVSEGEDNDGNGNTNTRQLSRLLIGDAAQLDTRYRFIYDNQDRISSLFEEEDDNGDGNFVEDIFEIRIAYSAQNPNAF